MDYAVKLYELLGEHGHVLMRRAVTFFAALAINQGRPGDALEILVTLKNQNYVTVRNLRVRDFHVPLSFFFCKVFLFRYRLCVMLAV